MQIATASVTSTAPVVPTAAGGTAGDGRNDNAGLWLALSLCSNIVILGLAAGFIRYRMSFAERVSASRGGVGQTSISSSSSAG